MTKAVILSACRTPGGKYGGSLKPFEATDLGGKAIAEAVKRSGIATDDIGEVIMGNGWQAGVGANPARIAMVKANLPQNIPAFTVNKRCGSSLRTIMLMSDRARLGDIKAGVAGGMESASNTPYLLPEARWGHRMGEKKVLDVLHQDGFICPVAGDLMGTLTERLVEEYNITRQEQDEYALSSHMKAVEAMEKKLFAEETVPLIIRDRKKGEIAIDSEEIPRKDTTIEALGRLPAIFKQGGTITAGSSSALCDAGSAVVVANEEWAKNEGHAPMARILGYASAALDADRFGIAPTLAMPLALEMAKMTINDMDLIEINEAFAAQIIACHRVMPLDMQKLNIHGGAIALGHPIGASGARILTTLLYALKNTDKEFGIASACIGGGQAAAIVVQRLN
ncbi:MULTISPECIES: thiolase family protein [Aminobacterium]|jgi:acetyl-CoA C-acetyltransferase|uniref:Acetyl-CoA acetyltransferase n=1 Tax=Aminobacterium colombiense (strain DSM 12261 / ALA-1) TaxID=572547 RepID=D5EFK0_AMICL|nr:MULTISPECIES: thiolase family protein [Aminobacterium]ADE57332.1 acetyl-CoA acetyltransferase [Aminobacterium colombiense DSM 12261]